MENFITIK